MIRVSDDENGTASQCDRQPGPFRWAPARKTRSAGRHRATFFQMKSRDTIAPIGPYLVTADEIKDPQKLQIRLWNNRALMQNFNTDDRGHKIVKCITWLSTIHTLLPGDIVATGTNHRGLNPFMDGD